MKCTLVLFLFLSSTAIGFSSCQTENEHKHGTQEAWQHQGHNHLSTDTADWERKNISNKK